MLKGSPNKKAELGVRPAIPEYRHLLLSGPAGIPLAEDGIDPRSLGLVLDDPGGYLRLKQMALGPEDAVISSVRATSYTGSMRDDTYFTFVLQGVGRYDIQISGRDYSMSPGGLLAFRPNERRTQVRAGKAGFRAATHTAGSDRPDERVGAGHGDHCRSGVSPRRDCPATRMRPDPCKHPAPIGR